MAGPTAKLLSAIALAPTRYAFMSRAWRVLSAHPSLPAFTTRTSEAVVEYPHLASALCLFFSSLGCVLAWSLAHYTHSLTPESTPFISPLRVCSPLLLQPYGTQPRGR